MLQSLSRFFRVPPARGRIIEINTERKATSTDLVNKPAEVGSADSAWPVGCGEGADEGPFVVLVVGEYSGKG